MKKCEKTLLSKHHGRPGQHGHARLDNLFKRYLMWTNHGHKKEIIMTILELAVQIGLKPQWIKQFADLVQQNKLSIKFKIKSTRD